MKCDYTADGDTTNVASRLESLCPPGKASREPEEERSPSRLTSLVGS